MKTITIQDDLYEALSKKVCGFNETPEDVIRRLLDEASTTSKPERNGTARPNTERIRTDLQALLESPDFRRSDTIDRYLAILEFLYRKAPERFEQLEVYRRKGGRRVNFSKEIRKIQESGNSTFPKKIPGTPFYVLTNLDNRSKRSILEDVMPSFGFSTSEIRMVQRELPDSGIRRA